MTFLLVAVPGLMLYAGYRLLWRRARARKSAPAAPVVGAITTALRAATHDTGAAYPRRNRRDYGSNP